MGSQEKIVVFNVQTGDFDIYTDMLAAATRVGYTSQGLRYILERGTYYKRGVFVGYGKFHKSNRGGRR